LKINQITLNIFILDRLAVRVDGKVQFALKNPFRDGTTYILFSPLDFLSKLAALVPRLRHNLVRYHGVLARGCRQPNARMKKLVVPSRYKRNKAKIDRSKRESVTESDEADKLFAPLTWAQRRDGEPLKQVFNMTGPPSDY
jgi:hypothetical protein